MAFRIVRTPDQIEAAHYRAQAAAFAAEDQGGTDEAADAIYRFGRWLQGHDDTDPTEEMGEDPDEGE